MSLVKLKLLSFLAVILLFSFERTYAKEFIDEADCRKSVASACLRMFFRDSKGPNSSKYLERASVQLEKSIGNDVELAASFTATSILYGKLDDKKSSELTTKILSNACDNGKNALACLGRFSTLSRPSNTKNEQKESKVWAKKADELAQEGCKKGDAFFCYFRSVTANLIENIEAEKMITLLEQACKLKEPGACSSLGEDAISKGDQERGISYLRQACDVNFSVGCSSLVYTLKKVGKLSEAITISQNKCKEGVGSACGDTTIFLSEQKRPDSEIAPFYVKACEYGDELACFDFGLKHSQAGRVSEARYYFKLSCNGGYSKGCYQLGMVEKSLGNKKEAQKLFLDACENKKSAHACIELGLDDFQRTNKPKGMVQYMKQAKKIWNSACTHGDNEACEGLRSLASLSEKFHLTVE